MRSELDMQPRAHGVGLTRQNQSISQVIGLEDVARGHVNITLDQGRHARTAAAFPARMRHVETGIEQHVDQALTARPVQHVPLTVQVERYDGCDF
jgi:hypothetical protein